MNQQLSYEVQSVMPQAVATGLFSALCTIQQPGTMRGSTGNLLGDYSDVAGLVAIPCVDSVPYIVRIQATEVKQRWQILGRGERHILLNGYYPESTPDGQIPTNWRAVVDGVIYDILGVEHDSQKTQTRLELQLVTL